MYISEHLNFDCIIYADDFVILAASLTMLQAIINLYACIAENELNMSLLELVLLLDTSVHVLI